MEELVRAAEAAGYAMASIEDDDYATPLKPQGDAVARGAREPKKITTAALVVAKTTQADRPVTTTLVEQSVAAGQAIRQAVYGYIGGRGAPA